MIAKTRNISKLVFISLAGSSFIFTVILFWDFGENYFSKTIWAIVGAGMESLKIIFLARLRNRLTLKKKVSYTNLVGYVSLALLCAFASLVFGIATIERQAIKSQAESVTITEIKYRIADNEQNLKLIAQGNDQERSRTSIQRQIDALTRLTESETNLEASMRLVSQIKQLENSKNDLANAKNTESKEKIIKNLTELKTEYGKQAMLENNTKNSFEVISQVLGIKQNTVMVIFLFLVVIAIEIGMAVTSGSAITPEPKKTKLKHKGRVNKYSDQLMMSENEKT